MWELDHKEGWAPKNLCFWIVVLENTLESPLDSKESKPVNPKGNQPWIFIGRTDAEAEVLIFGHPMQRADLLEKTLMLRKTEGRKRRGRQDEMVGCHHWLNGHEFEQTLGDSEGQGSLACCSLWGRKESDMIKWLNNNNSYLQNKYMQSTSIRKNFLGPSGDDSTSRSPQPQQGLCLWAGFSVSGKSVTSSVNTALCGTRSCSSLHLPWRALLTQHSLAGSQRWEAWMGGFKFLFKI